MQVDVEVKQWQDWEWCDKDKRNCAGCVCGEWMKKRRSNCLNSAQSCTCMSKKLFPDKLKRTLTEEPFMLWDSSQRATCDSWRVMDAVTLRRPHWGWRMISTDFRKCETAETKCQSWELRTDGGARCVVVCLVCGSAAGVNVRGGEERSSRTLQINHIYQAHRRMRHEIRV